MGAKQEVVFATFSSGGGPPVRIAILTDRVVPSKKKKEKPTPQRYELLGGPNVTVRHEDGHEEVIRLVGGLLQHDGIWHVTTYEMSPN